MGVYWMKGYKNMGLQSGGDTRDHLSSECSVIEKTVGFLNEKLNNGWDGSYTYMSIGS